MYRIYLIYREFFSWLREYLGGFFFWGGGVVMIFVNVLNKDFTVSYDESLS